MPETPVAVFEVDHRLLQALEAAFGPPIDSYLRGWQVWIEPVDESADLELEYRLHPPGGFAQPAGIDHHDLWDRVIEQVVEGADELHLGQETRRLDEIWTLLEVFPAFGDEVSAQKVREYAERALGRPAAAHGDVDHERLGGAFKRRGPDFDLPAVLRAELGL